MEEKNPHTKKAHDELTKLALKYGMQLDTNHTSTESPTPHYMSWVVRDTNKLVMKDLQKDLIALGYNPEKRWSNTHTRSPNKNFTKVGDANESWDHHSAQVVRFKTTGYTGLNSLHHHLDIYNSFQQSLNSTS